MGKRLIGIALVEQGEPVEPTAFTPGDAELLEDGVSYELMEDGVSRHLLEPDGA